MMNGFRVLWLGLAGAATVLVACPGVNDCDFWMRCDGGVVEQCGDGVDQQIGRRVRSTACPALNPVCVQDGKAAGCFAAAEPCDAGTSRCDGQVAYACSEHSAVWSSLIPMPRPYLLAEDCAQPIHVAADGGSYVRTCRAASSAAWCERAP